MDITMLYVLRLALQQSRGTCYTRKLVCHEYKIDGSEFRLKPPLPRYNRLNLDLG
jgi:hypothetical protein